MSAPDPALKFFAISDNEFERLLKRRVNQPLRAYSRPDPTDLDAMAVWNSTKRPIVARRTAEHLFKWGETVCPVCETDIDIELRRPHPGACEIDHVIPTSKGGDDTWGNIRLTHAHCNQRRNDLREGERVVVMMKESLAHAVLRFIDPEVRLTEDIARDLRWAAGYNPAIKVLKISYADAIARNLLDSTKGSRHRDLKETRARRNFYIKRAQAMSAELADYRLGVAERESETG